MTPSSTALAAACLAAGLVTAFTDTPAHALMAATTPTTSAGFQLYDGSFLTPGSTSGFNPDQTPPIVNSPQATTPGPGPVGVLLFTQAASATTLIGQGFDSAFLNGSTYTESQVIGYLEDPAMASIDQTQAYGNFVEDLGYRYGTSYDPQAGPIQAYLFSNGQNAGTFTLAGLGPNPSNFSSGFGLASEANPLAPPVTPAAVPEPGSLSLLLLGGAALAGVTARRRRRTH